MRAQRLPVSPKIMQERALQVTEELNINNFNLSVWWVSRSNRRFSVQSSIIMFSQATGICEVVHYEDMNELRTKMTEFSLDNMYNADETWIF